MNRQDFINQIIDNHGPALDGLMRIQRLSRNWDELETMKREVPAAAAVIDGRIAAELDRIAGAFA